MEIKLVGLPVIWHSVTERPENYTDVVVILRHPELQGKISSVLSVLYHDGHFNGKKSSMDDDVVCWAYENSFRTAFRDFAIYTQFGGDNDEKDTTGRSSGVSAEVR